MRLIQYIQLYNYLEKQEELEGVQILRRIFKIRRLQKKYLEAIEKILAGKTPELIEDGITYEELVDKDNFKPIRAILMLDWIRREPEAAKNYMAENYLKAPIMPLDKEEKEDVAEAIKNLRAMVKEHKPINKPKIDESKEDIIIEKQYSE